MSKDVISIFLASRFAEFRELRSKLTKRFARNATSGSRYELLDFDSESPGKPPVFEFCVKEVRNADVFVLLVGKTYPERGTAPDGKSVSHAEYEAALDSVSVQRIFIFLAHACYLDHGLDTEVDHPLMKDLLDSVRRNEDRKGHLVLKLPSGITADNADWIFSHIDATLNNDQVIFDRSKRDQTVDAKLNAVVMSSREKNGLDLPDAMERIAGANARARVAFKGRDIPDNPFDRTLFRRDDSCKRKILDFEHRLHSAGFGEVLGIVSPSGQGKSTFIASFPGKFKIEEGNYLFITGRELKNTHLEELFLDAALLAKTMATQEIEGRLTNRRFYLFVDALNECDSGGSLLLDLIVWLEQMVHVSANSLWPITILLTMRPDIAKTVPELSRILVRHDNTYDMEQFGEQECRLAFERFKVATHYEKLSGSMRKILRDPLMLGIVVVAYSGKALPQEDSDLDLLGTYIKRLSIHSRGISEEQMLSCAQVIAGQLLARASQTLPARSLDGKFSGATVSALLSAGILTDDPEQSRGREDSKLIAFRYDRVAEYCMGRYVESRLQHGSTVYEHMGTGTSPVDILTTMGSESVVVDVEKLSELHWSGLCLGFFFHIEENPVQRKGLLVHLMRNTNPRWRMLARAVLLKLYGTSREGERNAFRDITQHLGEYVTHNRSDREFRAEYMRMAFEVIAAEFNDPLPMLRRNPDLELLVYPVCLGLRSLDQEIADQAITSLSTLITHSELAPTILRQLSHEFERVDLALLTVFRKQFYVRLSIKLRRLVGQVDGGRLAAVPIFTAIKLLIVCFAASPGKEGHEACLQLLCIFLKRLKSSVIGRTLNSTIGKQLTVFILSTLLEIALRSNKMPINSREWKLLVKDSEQYDAFKQSIRLVSSEGADFDSDAIVASIAHRSPNPFIYQTTLTALSTKFELASSGQVGEHLAARVMETIDKLIAADTGTGVCKYVASLVLYHINTFGNHGNANSAKMMTSLALDILVNHDGLFGDHGRRYNSNVIGTTGRSLLNLSDRKIDLEEHAFTFIRAQIDKVKMDQKGEFTKYLIENLALLAILLPENDKILKLIKEEIHDDAVHSFTAPAVKSFNEWVLNAFVRIRVTHPVAVDSYLASSIDNSMYHEVRHRHTKLNLEDDVQGLSELVSWAFERVFFDLVVNARDISRRAASTWVDYLDASPQLKPASLVQLGLICINEGFAWAEGFAEHGMTVGVKVTSTP